MEKDKAKQEISIVGRLFSLEALILVMGIVSLGYGVVKKQPTSIFWGVIILVGFIALLLVRKKDWKKHWEDLEQQQKKDDGKQP